MSQPNPRLSSLFELEYPQSVGVYDGYPQAQAAVDFLADSKFAVQNLAIVGTDLKSVERVTGRRNWGTVLLTGVQSGLSTDLMVALILWFLQPQMNPLMLLPGALLIGILIGVTFAAIAYAASRGKRDFNSISQTVAGKYELLCEHKVAGQARELLSGMPGARAAAFDPRNQAAPWQAQQPYPPAPQTAYPAPPQQPYGQQQHGQPAAQQPPYGAPGQQSYGQAPVQQAPAQPAQQPYGSYGSNEGIGRAPSGDQASDSEQSGRTPRGDN